MTRFVLVHSPLVGPYTWAGVADALRERGHDVLVPRLRAEGDPYWAGYVDQVIAHVDEAEVASIGDGGWRSGVVLVAHSGAGALLPPIGSSLDVEAYVFVDAVLPRPDTSSIATMHPALRAKLESLAEGGMLPPWHEWWDPTQFERLLPDDRVRKEFVRELEPVPIAVLDEVVPPVDEWPEDPCAYLRLSAAYELEEAHAAREGWAVSRIDGTHLDVLSRADDVAVRILALLVRLGVGG